ncbi:MAG: hypothetical protein Q4D29_10670 [Lachnospiraceae bacterium]|nr:hypothetical protein [Lachnospiraceae bacterium]
MSAREIDNQYKRIGGNNSYRNQRFEGMKSMIDDYTGKRIFVDSTKHPVTTSAQVDHVIPLHVVQEKYPDLSLAQQKYIANHPSNYAMTNGKMNMHIKNGKMNHQVVAEQATETAKSVVEKVAKKDFLGAAKVSSDYVKTSSKLIKSEMKASANMAANSGKCRVDNTTEKVKEMVGNKNTTIGTKISGLAASSPEMAITSCIGNSVMNAAGGAVAGTVIVEAVNSIKENDDAETFVGNVAGRGIQAITSAGGGAVAGEIAGLMAIALGAGPVGWAATAIGTGVAVATGISSGTNELAEDISYAVSDGMENLRLNSGLVDGVCTVAENVGLGLGSLWDNTFGSWLL